MKFFNTKIVNYTCEQMFHLVSDIESYPRFLKFCNQGKLDQIHDDGYTATLEYQIGNFRKSFTTRNISKPYSEISMKLVSGLFKRLDGKWSFLPVGNRCQVQFEVEYEFTSKAAELTLGPFFRALPKITMENFLSEADRRFSGG